MGHSNEETRVDVVIVGAGIVGLWLGYELVLNQPGLTVAVCETEEFPGEHTTGRNSEVLHSGIYYEQNSLKHRHCMRGNELWRDFVKAHNLEFLPCGKMITASAADLDKLWQLKERGENNGVEGIRFLANQEVAKYTPYLNISEGLHLPSAGVLNVGAAVRTLKVLFADLGGILLTRSRVKFLDRIADEFRLLVGEVEVSTRRLVNCAGLGAVDFRKQLGLKEFEDFYVKGNYLTLRKPLPIDQLVYPIPPSHGLGLGVHLTIDVTGAQKFGPNTEPIHTIDYRLSEDLLEQMYPSVLENFRTVQRQDLALGYAGIRPKVKRLEKYQPILLTDFVLNDAVAHGISGYFEFLGIESPGITAAPSLVQSVSSQILA